jgi:hypothetical protein
MDRHPGRGNKIAEKTHSILGGEGGLPPPKHLIRNGDGMIELSTEGKYMQAEIINVKGKYHLKLMHIWFEAYKLYEAKTITPEELDFLWRSIQPVNDLERGGR